MVLVQGLNTPISDACMTGMSGALALLRGTTTEPTGADTLDDALALLDDCAIDADRLALLTCPTLVVRAEDSTSFPGQGATLLESLPTVAHELWLTHAEGAGADCGIGAPQIHDAKVYDRLDDRLRSDPADTHRPEPPRPPHLPETS